MFEDFKSFGFKARLKSLFVLYLHAVIYWGILDMKNKISDYFTFKINIFTFLEKNVSCSGVWILMYHSTSQIFLELVFFRRV